MRRTFLTKIGEQMTSHGPEVFYDTGKKISPEEEAEQLGLQVAMVAALRSESLAAKLRAQKKTREFAASLNAKYGVHAPNAWIGTLNDGSIVINQPWYDDDAEAAR